MTQVDLIENAKPARVVHRLGRKEMFVLIQHVQAAYAESGLTDVAFAADCKRVLGFEVVANIVAGIRADFSIENNRDVLRRTNDPLAAKIAQLETRVRHLEDRLAVYFVDGKQVRP